MIEKIKKYFVGSYEELKKVVWPSRQEIISHSIIVIISMAVAMAIISVIDFGLFNLVQYLLSKR